MRGLRRELRGRRVWPGGLRARLLVAFVLVTVLGAAAVAWSSARSASSALAAGAEQQFVETVTNQITANAAGLTYPPGQSTLDQLASAVGADTTVTYQHLRSTTGPDTDLVTDAVRAAVQHGDSLFVQRIAAQGRPWLIVGTPVMITSTTGARTPSGIQVYAVRDLTGVQRQIDSLTRSEAITTGLALPLAVLLALVAAGSVLRPVRRLRDTARRLSAGDLDARAVPRGADELADLTVTLNEMAESVQTSMAAMRRMQDDARRFAADASHELRTPLSTLTAVMEVLAAASEEMDGDARESAQLAIAETHRLVQLAEDLMEVSRFDAGTARLRTEGVEIGGAVRDCLRTRAWTDRVVLSAPEEIWSRCDRRRLDVIVANLVGNALRHGAPPVRVSVSGTPEQVWIEVTDSGPGLPEHVLPHVFDRFYKADEARTRAPGSGLGLAIALENTLLHGGELTAGNASSGGARFVVRLPRGREDT
ncbi:ATP-binding protein [Catenulispora pinisilvae]|uniref:ATP-binding protein n=1 Tax=Catenulispora pinisilvae TaxID=2705253 RepID=UPI003F6991DD